MIELKTDLSSKVPIYKQLMEQFEEGVRNGSLKPGEQVMSINAMAASLGISRETAIKVYSKLRERNILEASQGKGFYISDGKDKAKIFTVLVILDKLSAYKQTFINALNEEIEDHAEITILLHNQNIDLFEYYIDQNLGKFDYYVITPHFCQDKEVQTRVRKAISRVPNRQLIMADHWMKEVRGNYGAVYQDFDHDIEKGLDQGAEKLKSSGALHVITLENSLYGSRIEASVLRFCKRLGIRCDLITSVTPETISKGVVYLLLNSSLYFGLIELSRSANAKGYMIGRDISIISYNESPISEILLGGLTTVSTDFAQMGHLVGQMILNKSMTKIRCDFNMIRRASF